MTTHLLRVEGVNLYNILDDTLNISVNRGGSLLLREATARIGKALCAENIQAKAVSTGASVGLFRFSHENPQDIKEKMIEILQNDDALKHLSFVIDVQPEADTVREAIVAKNRFQQLQQLTVSIPTKNTHSTQQSCALDGVRPASAKNNIQGSQKQVSESVNQRFNYGKKQKKSFYQTETDPETDLNLNFTNDLGEIATDESQGALSGKLAIVYFDGNKFGQIQKNCDEFEQLTAFDTEIKKKRQQFLTEFLQNHQTDEGFLTTDNKFRLETLLWGGDEVLFVVPAWRGFQTLATFYKHFAKWQHKIGAETHALTHAGGLVFCHHKTPISRMRKLAQDLAESVKTENREKNAFATLVLESVDYPTKDVKQFWKKRYSTSNTPPEIWVPDDFLHELQVLRKLLADIPKGQMFSVVHDFLNNPKVEENTALARMEKVVGKDKITALTQQMGRTFIEQETHWQWIHTLELWDYLPKATQERAA
jgi:hypothetical protein